MKKQGLSHVQQPLFHFEANVYFLYSVGVMPR